LPPRLQNVCLSWCSSGGETERSPPYSPDLAPAGVCPLSRIILLITVCKNQGLITIPLSENDQCWFAALQTPRLSRPLPSAERYEIIQLFAVLGWPWGAIALSLWGGWCIWIWRNRSSTKLPRPWSTWRSSPSRKNSPY
jgi:hypothetical protein